MKIPSSQRADLVFLRLKTRTLRREWIEFKHALESRGLIEEGRLMGEQAHRLHEILYQTEGYET